MLRAGVDLGGTKIQAVIVDPLNHILGAHRRPTPTTGGPPDVADAMAEAVRYAAEDALADLADITGVGVGAPGQVDASAGTLSRAGNLPDWMGTYALAPELSARLGGVEVVLGNDVMVSVLSEVHLGAGRPFQNMVGIFCGTGVGGGIVIKRKMSVGRGAGGEIGHTVVNARDDAAPCTCGRRGCMEAYAGRAAMEIQARAWQEEGRATALFEIMEAKGRPRLASGVWATALARHDEMAEELINRAIWALGAAAASAINLLDPQAVIIGGGLGCRLGQPFVDQIRDSAMPRLIQPGNPPQILLAELGDFGGALGAALLVEEVALIPGQRTVIPLSAYATV